MAAGNREIEAREGFDRAMEAGFRRYCRAAPEVASFAGLTDHDGELPPSGREALESKVAALGAWGDDLARFDPALLGQERAYDASLTRRLQALHRFHLETLKTFQSNPDPFSDLGNLLFVTGFSDYSGPEERYEKLARRLEALPAWVEGARRSATRPEPRFARVAAEVAESFPEMLEALSTEARGEASPALASRIETAAARGKSAAVDHADWCRDRSTGLDGWAIGQERLEELLVLKGVDLPLGEIEALGERVLAEESASRARIAEEVAPGEGVGAALALVKEDHPESFPQALETVRALVAEARELVASQGIATLPHHEEVRVIETPLFMRPQTPFAAIFPAARYAKVQRGLYLVTPPPSEEGLVEVHFADLHNVVCHEAYPGHHLQLAAANQRTSVIRSADLGGFPSCGATAFAIDLIEGWAHYSEQLMKEHGFHAAPADRLALANDAVWRAARVLIDVRLHTGRLDFDGAVLLLTTATGRPRQGAEAEVNRYAMTPTYQLCYLLGKALLLDLKRETAAREGAAFSEKAFHDAVLAQGSVPLSDVKAFLQGRPPHVVT